MSFLDSRLPLSPLSPPTVAAVVRPAEVFAAWRPAQRAAEASATAPLPSIASLRATGFLPHDRAERIAEWYTGPQSAAAGEVKVAYGALASEIAVLGFAVT